MNLVSSHNMVCKEICDVLGLKNVRKLDLHMAYDEFMTVTAIFFPEEEGVRQLVPILKKYALLENREPNKNEVETTVIGDEIKTFAIKNPEFESFWLAEASCGGSAWYATSIDQGTILGTTNAWKAKKFNSQEECCDWIDSWEVPPFERYRFTPVSHGFVNNKED